MSDDPFLDLRHELLTAHRRERRRLRFVRVPSAGTLATAAVVILALALAAGFVVLLGGGAHQRDRLERAARRPAASTLKDFRAAIGLFRRPQTAADRDPRAVRLIHETLEGQAVPSTLRLGASEPWGQVFYVLAHVRPKAHPPFPSTTIASIVFEHGGGAVAISDQTLAQFVQRGSGSALVPPVEGLLIPDGYTSVRIHYPRQRLAGSPLYPQAITQVVTIHDNAALIKLPPHRAHDRRPPDWIEWEGPAGVHRIVNVRAHVPGGPGRIVAVP